MILVIGGAYQGKLDYIRKNYHISEEDIFNGEKDALEEIQRKIVIKDFHLLVKRLMVDNISVKEFVDQFIVNRPEMIIIGNEIGYGIVPMEKFERAYREETGRICCYLTKKADVVIRVYCGIGVAIKSEKG